MGKLGAILFAMLSRIGQALMPALVWNAIGLAGVVGISYGTWLIYEPAGFIAGGALLLVGAAVLAPRNA